MIQKIPVNDIPVRMQDTDYFTDGIFRCVWLLYFPYIYVNPGYALSNLIPCRFIGKQ